ncbi:Strongly-conserved Zn-finger binding protein (TFIIIA) [Arachnomyces sp. PD_36]|nr:Strongly-conserved Zn-finger binding protein (TFIIIA) [Arachnomyces sp. PD_36]
MTGKRKSTAEAQRQVKRTRKTIPDPIHEDPDFEAESLSSYKLSDDDEDEDDAHKTPITPFSPASAKYPSELKTHHCPFDNCSKSFNRPARLTEHLRSHNNDRIFKCLAEGCDKTFLRASHLSHHTKSAHTAIRDYTCDRDGCGKTFVTGSRLRRHLAAHEGRDKYRCTEYAPCNETFRKHSTLQKHITMVHLNKKPFPCPDTDPVTGRPCTQAFDTAGHLRAHQGRLHGGPRFTCTECTQSETNNETNIPRELGFPTYALLQQHLRAAHPPSCPHCSTTCSSTKELRRHLELAHGNVSLEDRKTHRCEYPGCDRSFTKKGNLTVHVRTVHEGEKRFVCGETDLSTSGKVVGWDAGDGCGKKYGSKLALEEHVRTAHLGFKNAKAERREQMGLSRPGGRRRGARPAAGDTAASTLTALTGDGYVEPAGRNVPCFVETCEQLFSRDYDLWLHMSGVHGFEEDDIQAFFMWRTMQGNPENHAPGNDEVPSYAAEFGDDQFRYGADGDTHMWDMFPEQEQERQQQDKAVGDGDGDGDGNDASKAMIPNTNGSNDDNDLSLIDPVLTYMMEQ